jgi:hypothetical protein
MTGPVLTDRKPTERDAVLPAFEPAGDEALRELAIRQVERVRSLKLHVIAFAFGSVALGGIWVLTEYLQDHRWPDRLADSGGPGTWNPWIFWAVGIWAVILGIHAIKTYSRRPATEAEIRRELERIRRK